MSNKAQRVGVKRSIQHKAKPSVVWCLETPPRVLYYSYSIYCPCYNVVVFFICKAQNRVLHDKGNSTV